MNSSLAKLVDKLMSHLDDELIEQLEGHLVGKASKIRNVPQMCFDLVQQNLLDEDDFQLTSSTKAQRQWAGKAIQALCSKKAIGSLVIALQRSGNEHILRETLELLETSSQRKKNHPVAAKSLIGQTRKDSPKAPNSPIVQQIVPSDGMKQVATLNCQLESSTNGTFALDLDQYRMVTRQIDGTVKQWNWRDDEQKTIKLGVQVMNLTWFQYDAERIVVGTSEGNVYLFDSQTLEEKWTIRLGAAVHALKFVESLLVVVTREDEEESFWWVDISRPDMRLGNQRVMASWINNKKTVFLLDSSYFFFYLSGHVHIRSVKFGKGIRNGDGLECYIRAPENMSTLHVVDLIKSKSNLIAGCQNGDIVIWDSRDFEHERRRTLKGHQAAVVSLCAVSGHLLSLDESGKLLMWSGYDLENKSIQSPVPRLLAQDFCNVTRLISHGRWFASIPRGFEKDSRNVVSWYKRWFGSSSPKDANVDIWTLPDLWLRTG